MSNIFLALIFVSNLAFLFVLAFLALKIRRFENELRKFFSPATNDKGENVPSAFAQTTDAISAVFSRSLVASLKATFMGKQSGAARGEQAIENAVLQDSIGQTNPLFGLLTSFPAVQKALRKNPGLIDAAMQFMANRNQASQPGSNGHTELVSGQPRFKL